MKSELSLSYSETKIKQNKKIDTHPPASKWNKDRNTFAIAPLSFSSDYVIKESRHNPSLVVHKTQPLYLLNSFRSHMLI